MPRQLPDSRSARRLHMSNPTKQHWLELRPQARLDLIDVAKRLRAETNGTLDPYAKLLFCSMHTTAGYLDQALVERMQHRRQSVKDLVRAAQRLFPEGAAYWHDRMSLRTELSADQKDREPLNADSHLAYIGLGLDNCASYDNRSDIPVYFIDLDGVVHGTQRSRRTLVVGYNSAETVAEFTVEVPVSPGPIDTVNLDDAELGLAARIEDLIREHGVTSGVVRIALDAAETDAGLTVNEYEPLLVRNDLPSVLRNPLQYMREQAVSIIRDPLSLPTKARHYLRHDLVQIIHEIRSTIGRNASLLESLIHRLGINVALLDSVIDRVATVPAPRWLRVGRAVSLLVAENGGAGRMIRGRYQSPILLQWHRAQGGRRKLAVTIRRFAG